MRAGERALAKGAAGVAALALLACPAARPVSRPAGDEGMVIYQVGALSFEAPQDWEARGDAVEVKVESRDGRAIIGAQALAGRFSGEAECLSRAEESLARGAGELTNARRHPTTFAGRRALAQEADSGAWHAWAYAVCDGATQYRLFLTGLSPVSREALDAWRALVASAQLGGRP